MIKLQNISKTYNTGKIAVHALRNINLEIKQGEFVAIMGASGSGKSTLLHILGFLDQPDCGSYLFYDTEITELDDDQCALLRNHSAGFVFQQFHLLPRITALENAELPLIYAGKRHLRDVALEKIRDVGLASRANHCLAVSSKEPRLPVRWSIIRRLSSLMSLPETLIHIVNPRF